MPSSTLALALIIGILAPISLFRGPLSSGAPWLRRLTVLSGLGTFNPLFLFNVCACPEPYATAICPTQGRNMWG
jgi:hypothetical protein